MESRTHNAEARCEKPSGGATLASPNNHDSRDSLD